MIADLVVHTVVSSVILTAALAAAAWIPRLTARTRHAVLVTGMIALVLPAPYAARLIERNEIVIEGFRGAAAFRPPAGLAGGLEPGAPPVSAAVLALWLGVAAMLLLRWWIVTQRLLQNAMRAATPPPPRAVKILESARRRLALHHSVDLIASSTCEAPAVVRVVRPTIILPADGCDALDDQELESLLCHECAHVARRDHLLGVFEALVCSFFWFNPLVWLAHRRIAAAREAACDERVADAELPAETYAGALAKVCRTLLAPRVAAVSCMASAHLKERILHLMSYDTIRKSAFPHRAVAAASLVAVILAVGAASVVTADPAAAATPGQYRVDYSMNKTESGRQLTARLRVVDTSSGAVLSQPTITMEMGQPAAVHFERTIAGEPHQFTLKIDSNADGSGKLNMVVTSDGREIQNSVTPFPAPGVAAAPRYSGQPITLNLARADIRDVLRTLGELTGIEIVALPGVEATVTVKITNMPWDQALEQILSENGFSYRLQDGRIEVYRP